MLFLNMKLYMHIIQFLFHSLITSLVSAIWNVLLFPYYNQTSIIVLYNFNSLSVVMYLSHILTQFNTLSLYCQRHFLEQTSVIFFIKNETITSE